MRSSRRIFAIALAAVLATGLAGCNEKRDPGFQGWVEADMILSARTKRAGSRSWISARAMR